MKKASFGDRFRYKFDTFMSRGTIALVGALFAVTFLLILGRHLDRGARAPQTGWRQGYAEPC